MNTGKLHKNEKGEWVIWHKKEEDLVSTDGGNIPIHEQHNFWLKLWGEEGQEMNYVIDNNLAVLKSGKPDTHEYSQD